MSPIETDLINDQNNQQVKPKRKEYRESERQRSRNRMRERKRKSVYARAYVSPVEKLNWKSLLISLCPCFIYRILKQVLNTNTRQFEIQKIVLEKDVKFWKKNEIDDNAQ